jgi:putative ABC transport system permease protein
VSGFLVADYSMLLAYQEGFTKYNIEDGHFTTNSLLTKSQRKKIEKNDVTLYDNYYTDTSLSNGTTLRIFKNRKQVNKVCLMSGKMPASTGEIAIDRMYADNNNLSVGDSLENSDHSWVITGLVALSDYSCLFQNNSDMMFDASEFGVSIVTADEFSTLNQDNLTYCYSWKYDTAPKKGTDETIATWELMQSVHDTVSLSDFVPLAQNQAIQFTGDDMGSDRIMMLVLLYIVIIILAFVFGITTTATIQKEATTIGTLLSSGYTKQELIRHYMTMPLLITLFSALIGNLLGYTCLKDICADMYYGSYSLPTYVTVWNTQAFILTTLIPLLLMLGITYVTLYRKLSLSPMKFLRQDLSKQSQKDAVHLSHHIAFFKRFRLRIIFQNRSNYIVLLIGILFANLLLLFGLSLPSTLEHYQANISSQMLCNYQYILKDTDDDSDKQVSTDQPDAQKVTLYSLKTVSNAYINDEVLLYGIDSDSRYINLNPSGNEVYVSSAYAQKYNISSGDIITLKEPYSRKSYGFLVTGIYDYDGSLCIFLSRETLNDRVGYNSDYYNGYLSDSKITDIDKKSIATTITLADLTKVSRQLMISMGNMMYLVDGFSVMIFIILLYLLSKIIIEKNSLSISIIKILGYRNLEISKLYIMATSIMVILFLFISLPAEYVIMSFLFRTFLCMSMSGWIRYYVPFSVYLKMLALGIITYLLVVLLEMRKIKKIPMDQALKNIE